MNIDELLLECRKGNNLAKEILLGRCKPLILSSIRKYHNIGDYDDLIQEGNLVLLESIDSFKLEYGVHFLGYLKMKLRYYYLDKKTVKLVSLNERDEDGIELLDKLGTNINIEEDMIFKEREKSLLEDIDCLSNRQKEIIIMFYFKDLSIGEIAKNLGLKYQTVANIKTRGINILKRVVKKS